ncbi:nitrate/nitrite transport system permease protein [Lewinella aquimaris]|uniref:Nitrate/nitrite transport system permease protein n=1 Tax=Neolewinella aquimaris TaxID=1835722 RepID=A0A840E7E0_9BACT|nr:ABC transporter permease [Neolewinella aquimaris]MBB4079157.1 nitrate/nitrite transport system permease protein [Neolewinella aquimaris]
MGHPTTTPVAPAPRATFATLAKFLPRRAKLAQRLPDTARTLGISLASMAVFLLVWQLSASYLYGVEAEARIERTTQEQGGDAGAEMAACIASGNVSCKPNTLPFPSEVVRAAGLLLADHRAIRAKKAEFQAETEAVNAARSAQGLSAITYTGRPSFVDQIGTSLKTVVVGFLISLLIAVPLGVVIGLNNNLRIAFNWMIQVFKPVSPVVWLLLVFMIVKTLTLGSDTDTSFLISSISVGLCAMWATLVNTSVGVSSVNKDYINVARVLNLGIGKKIFKVILPSAIPMIFTGMRITVSVAWMVLIAIELLAQSPGLGSFVWEEFQNGGSDSNAKILVAMFVIGLVGFLLDRLMFYVQRRVSFETVVA